jgi:ubiquinone/menaquinone biosynthesis C-methylase UbiE
LFFVALTHLLTAQSYLEIIDTDSSESKEERLELMLDFLKGIDFENAADIGSGNLEFILKIANHFPEKQFVLEDIDSTLCNKINSRAKIKKHQLTHIDTNRISIHIGTATSTELKENQFDIVILSGLIHEIESLDLFFSDLHKILKPGGSLIISDAFYEDPPNPHQGCSRRFLTHLELKQIIEKQDLLILKEWQRLGVTSRSNGEYASKIFQCSFKN